MSKRSYNMQHYRSPWLVLLLGVATLGIYSYIWTSRRYEESVDSVGWKNHWSVAALVFFVAVLLGIGLGIISPFVIHDATIAAMVTIYGSGGLLVIAHVFMTWWLVRHVILLNEAWQIATSPLSTTIMGLLFSPILVWYAQRRLNDDEEEAQFIRPCATILAVILGVAMTVLVYANYPIATGIESLQAEYQVTQEYITCHQELDAAYPGEELDDAEYSAYVSGYDECESIMEDW